MAPPSASLATADPVGVITEPPWVHKTVGISARNGTTSRTITFSTFGDAPFTPTAGNLLVVVVFGAVTNTVSGWTERVQPVNSGELSVFEIVAAGTAGTPSSTTSITVTNNGSNYPEAIAVLELPAGSVYTSSTGSTPTSDTFPALGSLPGTERLIIAARGRVSGSVLAGGSIASSVWSAPWVEDADLFTAFATTDGVYLTVGHKINETGTTVTPAATTTYDDPTTWNVTDREHVVLAYNAVATGSTTPFTKDYSILARVLNTFTKDTSVLARVLNGFTKDVDLQARVLNTFTKDYSVLARVLNTFTKDTSLLARVLNTWTKDYDLQARVLNSFTKDYSVLADVLSSTGFTKDYSLLARVLNSWTVDYSLPARVLNTFTKDVVLQARVLNAWQKDYDLQARVLNGFARDYVLQARVLNGFTVDVVLQARVLNGFTKDTVLLANVLADTSFVRTYVLLANVRELWTVDYVLRARVLSDTTPPPLRADAVARLEDVVSADLDNYAVGYLRSDVVVAYLG